jgi:cobalt-zinc-cadmium efflux system outer membrane protein
MRNEARAGQAVAGFRIAKMTFASRGAVGLVAALGLAACAQVNPDHAFHEVSDEVSSRTGQSPRWARTDDATREADEASRALLRDGLTVDEAVGVALIRNPSLQATFAEIGISQADLAQSGLIANPTLSGFVRFATPGSGTNTEVSIVEDWLSIFLLPLRKKLGEAQLEQTKLLVADRVTQLVADVRIAYHTVEAREHLAKRLRLIVELNRIAVEFAGRQLEAGTIGELDLVNQQALLSQSKVELALTESAARRDREALNRFLGLWGQDTAWSIPDEIPEIPREEMPLDGLEALAMNQRQDLRAARWGVDLIGRALSIKKKTRFFPIGINVGVETERDLGGERVTGPNFEVQLPIFDTGKASIARLESERLRAMRQLDTVAVDARSEVREFRDLMVASRELAEFYRSVLLPQRSRALDLTLLHYNMMLKGNYDLLFAKQQQVEVEKAYVEAWRDYWIARAQLERAVGGKLPTADREAVTPPSEETSQ